MQKITKSKLGIIIVVVLLVFSVSSCSVKAGVGVSTSPHPQKTKKIPPGQAKKMNGDKSAKKYAPGQNK